jgi:hypothetical protein
MTTPIRLHAIEAGPEDPLRLHAFPGRHLGEREFDLLQAYAEARLDPLLAPRLTQTPPGILQGLELDAAGSGADTRLHLRPGTAVSGDGRPLRLFYPLDLSWTQLLELNRRQAGLAVGVVPQDGLWLITLRRCVEASDTEPDAEPCTRTEPDPLRDLRLETVALAGLALVSANPRWLAMGQARAANRVCVRHLDSPPFDPVTGAVPLALMRIQGGLPAWIDPQAGRIEARPDGPYRTLLAHTLRVLEAYSRAQALQPEAPAPSVASLAAVAAAATRPTFFGTALDRPPLTLAAAQPGRPAARVAGLAARLGIDYLPAAGPFPRDLVQDMGGASPRLGFAPEDLQVELAPVPARTVPATLAQELPRGLVDLTHGLQERIRVLVAVDDPDYRPDLLNLPEADLELVAELDRRGQAATTAYLAWRAQWQVLYAGQDGAGLTQAQAPALPDPEPDFLANLVAVRNLQALIAQRAASLPEGGSLPEPYATWVAKLAEGAPQPPVVPAAAGDGLHARRTRLKAEIAALEDDLDANFDLLNAIGDYQTLQRQHLDSITVSFSNLAGGVPGDGSGSALSRWVNYAVFRPETKAP